AQDPGADRLHAVRRGLTDQREQTLVTEEVARLVHRLADAVGIGDERVSLFQVDVLLEEARLGYEAKDHRSAIYLRNRAVANHIRRHVARVQETDAARIAREPHVDERREPVWEAVTMQDAVDGCAQIAQRPARR